MFGQRLESIVSIILLAKVLKINWKMSTVRISDVLSFAWTYTSSRVVDYYRHYFSEAITVTTKSGPVKGYKIVSSFDYNYYNFHGIPYAKPPVDELRFKVNIFFKETHLIYCGLITNWIIHQDPQPFEPSTEIINEQHHRSSSIACQIDLMSQRPIGNENCLHLSVYTRDIKPDTLKPVMVLKWNPFDII